MKEREDAGDGQLALCQQQMPLICPKINLTGAELPPESFKGGLFEFINILSCVYFTKYIIHRETSFNLLIQDQLGFLWISKHASMKLSF